MSHHLFIQDLRKHLSCSVLDDNVSLGLYATDASLYQITPIAVLLPASDEDVIRAVSIARDHKIAIIPRGGGTGLAGQTIGKGLIIDFSKHLNEILEVNPEERWARVQPGVVRDNLNQALSIHNLHFAPDPATSSRANIGGMAANNSSGTKSILYGKTIDHIIELKVLLSDGTILHLREEDEESYREKSSRGDRQAEIFKKVKVLIEEHKSEIESRFPKVMRRVGGYNLDEFIHTKNWNLSRLVVGSEGTLGLILEAKINLEPLPAHKCVCLVHFSELQESIVAVKYIVEHGPAAVEILDRTVIELSRKNLTTQRSCHVIEGHPASVLIVEFYGNTQEEVLAKPQPMIDELEKSNLGYAFPVFPEGPAYDDVWTIRKKGLGLMLGMKGKKKPLAFIEDAGIPIEVLPQYIAEVKEVCDRYETQAAMYAHASVGVIHVRPILDLRDAEDIERFKGIAEATFHLVKKYKGSWSGEHGDGLVRSPFNEEFFGKTLYQVFEQIKQLFDPDGIMNPGKIIHAPPIDHNLRYGTSYQDQPLTTHYHYRVDGSFHDAVHMCSGVGECRKTISGTMCPSFMATMDEEHSTRGRANALRLAMSGQFDAHDLTSDRVLQTLDLCLSCKACKSECPSNVDMAKLKSEVWQMKYDHTGIPLRARFIRDSSSMARKFSGPQAAVINSIQRSGLFRWALEKIGGISRQRSLPQYAIQTFTSWYNQDYQPPSEPRDQVVLFADTYMNHHEPQVGISAAKLLSQIGYEVIVADVGCCQRPKLSNGFLRSARQHGMKTIEGLKTFLERGKPILVCEPSCASAFNHDLPDLIENEQTGFLLREKVMTVASFVRRAVDEYAPIIQPSIKVDRVLLHGHCHEKSLYGTEDVKFILQQVGLKIDEIDSGCCGMAGSFGYEKEHYQLSKKIGNRRLFPAIQEAGEGVCVVANGFSCRHQVEHFTGVKAKFWTELFD